MAIINGTAGADSVSGSGSNNGLPALSATETDVVLGDNGNDTVVGNATNGAPLFVFGGTGNDQLSVGGRSATVGGGANSALYGEDGNDTLRGGLGYSEIMDGGIGEDSIAGSVFTLIPPPVTLPFGTGSIMRGGAGNDTISAGSQRNVIIDGGDDADSIVGGSGGTDISGGAGNDTILTGLAYYNTNSVTDTVDGGAGNDLILRGVPVGGSNAAALQADGGAGADTIEGGGFNDLLFGGFGADSIVAGAGNDSVSGDADNDTISGGAGFDTIGDLLGNNVILAGADGDRVHGGAGNDSIDGQEGNDRIDAGDGNNTLVGGLDNDSIMAGFGTDSIDGGAGNDVAYGGGNADTLLGDSGNDSLYGGDSGDRLNGGAGNDRVLGEGGADTVLGSLGNDFLDGSGDTDLLDYSGLGAGVSVVIGLQFGFGRVVKRDASGTLGIDTAQGFEEFAGTANNDKFIGWGQDDTFLSSAGNDTFDGSDGGDTVRFNVAGAGNVHVNLLAGTAQDGLGGTDLFRRISATNSTVENIQAGGGADTIIGDADNNGIRGGLGADSLDGGAGIDLLDFLGESTSTGVRADLAAGSATDAGGSTDSFANFENLRGTDAADTLSGDAGANQLRGARGADLLDGGLGFDTTDHRNDADGAGTIPGTGDGFGVIVNLSAGAVTVAGFGAESNVVVGAARGRDGWGDIDVLTGVEGARGSNFNDVLVGAARPVTLVVDGREFSNADRSFLHGRVGDDTLQAASESDGVVASYSDDISGIVARLDLGDVIVDGFGTTDTLVNVRNVQGSDYDDLIVAHADGSWMRGRAGNDTLAGGAGIDNINYGTAAAGIVANLITGMVQDGDGWADSVSGIEVIGGSVFADTITADDSSISVFAGAGADSIIGGLGEDVLTYYTVTVAVTVPQHTAVSVNLTTGTARDGDGTPAGGSIDRFSSIEHAIGTAGADTLIGSAGANSLVGAEGADSLFGVAGDDTIEGGAGADNLSGHTGIDTAAYAASAAAVSINLGLVTAQLGGGDGVGDTLVGFENVLGSAFNDVLVGSTASNLLEGGAGADALLGGAGNDTHAGGLGNDTMSGGAGLDAFLFALPGDHGTGAAGRDRINDFAAGSDVIQVVGAAFGGLPVGVLAAGRFALNAPADGDDVFIFNTTTRVLSYDADGTGAGLALQLTLMNVATLAATDILIV